MTETNENSAALADPQQSQSALAPQPEPQKPAPEPKVTPEPLRTDGPTLEEYVAAGYKAENYPPKGYAAREAPPPAPPVDNDHVAAGAEQFATAAPKPVLIKPTVGRVVWYWPSAKAVNDGEQPRAAILTYVQDDHTVNLVSFGHDGFPLPHRGIRLLEVDEPPPASGHFACWMPFQAGQAKSAQSPGSPALATQRSAAT